LPAAIHGTNCQQFQPKGVWACLHLPEGIARDAILAPGHRHDRPSLQAELQPFLQEANEFIAILTTLLKNARLSQARGSKDLQ
jgi:hypothetical protein